MRKLYFILLLTICLTGMACEKNEPKNEEQSLKNTKWKLVGLVDTKTDSMQEFEPKDCDQCYTLTFDADSTLEAFSSANEFYGNYVANYETGSFIITDFVGTEIVEFGDGGLYVWALGNETLLTFSIQENELKLYYDDNKKYLLFKRIKS